MSFDAEGAFAEGNAKLSDRYFIRIQNAYQLSTSSVEPTQSALWAWIGGRSAEIHDALMNETDVNRLGDLLSNPADSFLFYGFDNLFKDDFEVLQTDREVRLGRSNQILSLLSSLSDAIGASRYFNPEVSDDVAAALRVSTEPEDVLTRLETTLGPLKFINPFNGEHGLMTTRGLISYRALQAIYQAWRTHTVSELFGDRVLEIGAGLGRSAYYATCFGLTDYTLVDLPMTSVAQALFLGHALGEDLVSLSGEMVEPGKVAILSPEALNDSGRSFDLVVNVDSLTEMTTEDAARYAAKVAQDKAAFLSINHESNRCIVRDFFSGDFHSLYRCPYWLRPGYIEELFSVRKYSSKITV